MVTAWTVPAWQHLTLTLTLCSGSDVCFRCHSILKTNITAQLDRHNYLSTIITCNQTTDASRNKRNSFCNIVTKVGHQRSNQVRVTGFERACLSLISDENEYNDGNDSDVGDTDGDDLTAVPIFDCLNMQKVHTQTLCSFYGYYVQQGAFPLQDKRHRTILKTAAVCSVVCCMTWVWAEQCILIHTKMHTHILSSIRCCVNTLSFLLSAVIICTHLLRPPGLGPQPLSVHPIATSPQLGHCSYRRHPDDI